MSLMRGRMSKIKQMLIKHEGIKLKPYVCPARKLTIGVGRNLEDKGISEEEALYLLDNDIKDTTNFLKGFSFFDNLNTPRRDAIIDFCFNVGFGTFVKFKRMIKALEFGDYKAAAKELLDSKYAKQVGNRALELAYIIETGNYL